MSDRFNQSIRALVDEFASRLTAECKKQLTHQLLEDVLRQMGQVMTNGHTGAGTSPTPPAPSSSAPVASGGPQTASQPRPAIMPPEAHETPPEGAQRPSEPPSSVGRRTRAQLECIAEELAALLKRRKGGLRMEELQHEMGISSSELEIPVRMALSYGWVKKRGQRRGTVYYTK